MQTTYLLPPLALLLAACATTTTRSHFRRADMNHDRKLDRQEFNDGVAGLVMEKFDSDKNGVMCRKEWRAIEGTANDKGFNQRDANRDGKVTMDEMKRMVAKGPRFDQLFSEIDTNQDGSIVWSEVLAYKKAHPEPAKAEETKTTTANS